LKKTPQAVNQQLSDMGLIIQKENGWELTSAGRARGGIHKNNEYRTIIWPLSITNDVKEAIERTHQHIEQNLLISTSIGSHFRITPQRTNYFLSDLGWIRKEAKGWMVTEFGKRLGGIQSYDNASHQPYVRWPETIVNNPILIKSIHQTPVDMSISHDQAQTTITERIDFRNKFPTPFRALDGHWVRSQAELSIDDFLCYYQIFHCYEKKLNTDEDVLSDFYIPKGKVYIEYWGITDNSQYLANKNRKLGIYHREQLNLIEIEYNDIKNLDDTLTQKLRSHGVKFE
jgi:hypothetical protein